MPTRPSPELIRVFGLKVFGLQVFGLKVETLQVDIEDQKMIRSWNSQLKSDCLNNSVSLVLFVWVSFSFSRSK